jgi:CheY-like chemotaxis protein
MKDMTYLYVEDDPLSREALTVIMRRVMGLRHVYVFEDSTDFLLRVEELPQLPDIFLLDIHMQPFNGFEMLEMLRQDVRYHGLTVIALTASVMSEEVELLKSSGFDGVIGKPVNIASFPGLIARIAAGEKVWHVTDM